MRLGICEAHGIKYFGSYTEEQAALFLGRDPSTLKRWRAAKKIFPVIDPGGRGLRYLGFMIADMISGRHKPLDEAPGEQPEPDKPLSPETILQSTRRRLK